MPDKQIDCVVTKVFDEKVSKRGTIRVRVVRWIVDGKDTGPQLEKREFYANGDQEKMGKAKGFNPGDLRMILERHIEIEEAMEQKPPEIASKVAEQKAAQPAAVGEDDGHY